MELDLNKHTEAILHLLLEARHGAQPRGWWLHCEAIKRQSVPIDKAILTNCHDRLDKESQGTGVVCLPIDEVLGWTDSAQTALDFLTIAPDSMDAWLDMFVPVERRPSVPLEAEYKRQGRDAPSDQQILEFPVLHVPGEMP